MKALYTLLLCAVLGVFGTAAHAAQTWHYDTPQETLPAPEWTQRVVFLEAGYNVPFADAERTKLNGWAQALQDMGVTILAVAPDADIPVYQKVGIKVVRGMRPFVREGWNKEMIEAHPEWLLVDDKGVANPDSACLVSPFGEAFIKVLAGKVTELGADGFQFDGWYQTGYCACPSCKETFPKETGIEFPPKKDPADLRYKHYLVWRDEKLLERAKELRTAVKAVNPEFILVNWSNNDAQGAYPSWMPETLNAVFDLTTKEWWDSNDPYSIWQNKRMRGASGDRFVCMQSYNFMRMLKDTDAGVYHGSSNPHQEMMYRISETLAFGAVPWVWPGTRAGYKPEKDWTAITQAWLDFLPFVHETKTVKYAACIDSYTTLQMSEVPLEGVRENSRDIFDRCDEKVGFARGGMARALLEAHIPFDVLAEHNVTAETLGQYKVIILPNNFCMSDRIAVELREYVKNGGGLVATYETSLFDEWGVRRPDFALADLFGASYVESQEPTATRVGYMKDVKSVITDDAYLHDLTGDNGYTTYWGRYARVKKADAAIAPMWGLDTLTAKTDASKQDWTPLVVNEYGKGRVAYFPAQIDHAYFTASYPYQRVLLANATRWAAQAEEPVKITGPMCIIGGFLQKETPTGHQTIVQLLNDVNTTLGKSTGADQGFSFREEVLPVRDVKVTFKGPKPQRVMLIPGQTALDVVESEGGWTATVQQIDLHVAVVAEYAK